MSVPGALDLSKPTPPSDDVGKALFDKLYAFKQHHVLKHWGKLSAEEKDALKVDIENVDLNKVETWFRRINESPVSKAHATMVPVGDEVVTDNTDFFNPNEDVKLMKETGLKLISQNKVAACLMAGGQGTRLGSKDPKGMFPLELKEGKTLLEIQAHRIRKLEQLAQKECDVESCTVPWYIMTSAGTRPKTAQFLKENDYFGLSEKNIIIFEQQQIPCLTTSGRLILATKSSLARSPDGNGGIYDAMNKAGVINDMETRGVGYVHVYGVDNILVQVADPIFVGFMNVKNVEVGSKCVIKQDPEEKVGMICTVNNEFQVVEYSEIDPTLAAERRNDGMLRFNAGSIANHMYTTKFVKSACEKAQLLKHHVAHKKIPTVDEQGNPFAPTDTNGIKLELFVFDVFSFASSLGVLQVDRHVEFAPLKNASTAKKDCVESCRSMLYAHNRRSLISQGTTFVDAEGKELTESDFNDDPFADQQVCEISPLRSYSGEGLQEFAKKKLSFPVVIGPPE